MHHALLLQAITSLTRTETYDERGDIIAADDVGLHHSALRLLAQKVSVHLLTASK